MKLNVTELQVCMEFMTYKQAAGSSRRRRRQCAVQSVLTTHEAWLIRWDTRVSWDTHRHWEQTPHNALISCQRSTAGSGTFAPLYQQHMTWQRRIVENDQPENMWRITWGTLIPLNWHSTATYARNIGDSIFNLATSKCYCCLSNTLN